MTNTDHPVPPELLHAVQTVLAGAYEHLAAGWRRAAHDRGAAGGARLIDALNYASADTKADRNTHLLAFACVTMAVLPHTGTPAHDLLRDELVDEYLSPDTDAARLHQLDAAIVVKYNTDVCSGAGDARALLLHAHNIAEHVISVQLGHAPAPASV